MPTLADLGVTKVQSSKWQKLAALPEDEFEDKVDFAKERAGNAATSPYSARPSRSLPPRWRELPSDKCHALLGLPAGGFLAPGAPHIAAGSDLGVLGLPTRYEVAGET